MFERLQRAGHPVIMLTDQVLSLPLELILKCGLESFTLKLHCMPYIYVDRRTDIIGFRFIACWVLAYHLTNLF